MIPHFKHWHNQFLHFEILNILKAPLYILLGINSFDNFFTPLKANLSLVWVVLVILFTYKLLLSLNGLYFEGEESAGKCQIWILCSSAFDHTLVINKGSQQKNAKKLHIFSLISNTFVLKTKLCIQFWSILLVSNKQFLYLLTRHQQKESKL